MTKRSPRSTTPTSPTSSHLLDDRLFIALVLGADLGLPGPVATTTGWYFRVVHSALTGAPGHLYGPFQGLDADDQRRAVEAVVAPPSDLVVAAPADLFPAIVEIVGRHPTLNFMNVEAAAAARVLGAVVLLSPAAAKGVLPKVLDDEGIPWETRDPFRERSSA